MGSTLVFVNDSDFSYQWCINGGMKYMIKCKIVKKVLVFISDFKATWSEYISCNIKQTLATIQFIDKELDKIRGVDKGGGKNKWYLQNL